jgi:hypothetical protein
MSNNNGGPAFPYEERNGDGYPVKDYFGITVRDYFAAQALQGLLADQNVHGEFESFANNAYGFADAMLKAREQA